MPAVFSRGLLNADGDVARHLVLGRHVMDHGITFPDPFSHTRPGETFTAYEWLSEVIFALAEGLGGLPAVAALAGWIIAASLALVAVFLRGRLEPFFALPVTFLAAALTAIHWVARPHLFSFLCLALLLVLLTRPPDFRRHLATVVLFALWANLHPGFIYGLAILAAHATGAVLDDRRSLGPVAITVLAAGVGTLINPLGSGLHASIFHHLQDQRAFELVDEFAPLRILSVYGGLFLAVVVSVVALFIRARRRIPWATLLVFGAAVLASFVAKRNAPLFALFALPMAMASVADLLHGWKGPRTAELRKALQADDRRASTLPWVVLTTGIVAGLAALSLRFGDLHPSSSRFSSEVFPVEAVEVAREAGLEELKMFNIYGWGGYLLHAWPEQRIYIDGMANFFGSALMEEYQLVLSAGEGWEDRLEARDIELLILRPESPLSGAAAATGRWQVLHEDATAVLLRRAPSGSEPRGVDDI